MSIWMTCRIGETLLWCRVGAPIDLVHAVLGVSTDHFDQCYSDTRTDLQVLILFTHTHGQVTFEPVAQHTGMYQQVRSALPTCADATCYTYIACADATCRTHICRPRHAKFVESSHAFVINQYGLSAFERTGPDTYVARTFNFYLFPQVSAPKRGNATCTQHSGCSIVAAAKSWRLYSSERAADTCCCFGAVLQRQDVLVFMQTCKHACRKHSVLSWAIEMDHQPQRASC